MWQMILGDCNKQSNVIGIQVTQKLIAFVVRACVSNANINSKYSCYIVTVKRFKDIQSSVPVKTRQYTIE